MAKIRKIYDQTIEPNGIKKTIYPITSTRAVFTPEGEHLDQTLTKLNQKIEGLALGKFYGFFPEASDLPEGDVPGYAYVGLSNPFDIYTFINGEWGNSGTIGTNIDTDEEDITFDTQGKLQFADRPNTDRMGYTILRKNKAFNSQVVEENTIYEIRYNFDLDGASVTIPEGCILKFNGGSIANGTLVGQNTKIDAVPVTIFNNISFSGNWNVPAYYVEWFGVTGDGETDDTAAFQSALALGLGYYLATGNYKITGTLLVRNANTLDGNNRGKIIFDASAAEHPESLVCVELAVERAYMWQHTRLINITLQGSNYNEENYNSHHEDLEPEYYGYGVYCNKRTEVDNCYIVGFNYGLVAASYEVHCNRSSLLRNFVNVGIASADLYPPDGNWAKQTNAVTIEHSILKMPRSGDSVTIGRVTGRNPWASASSPNPGGNGHLNIIDDCTVDGGRIVVENIAQIIRDAKAGTVNAEDKIRVRVIKKKAVKKADKKVYWRLFLQNPKQHPII